MKPTVRSAAKARESGKTERAECGSGSAGLEKIATGGSESAQHHDAPFLCIERQNSHGNCARVEIACNLDANPLAGRPRPSLQLDRPRSSRADALSLKYSCCPGMKPRVAGRVCGERSRAIVTLLIFPAGAAIPRPVWGILEDQTVISGGPAGRGGYIPLTYAGRISYIPALEREGDAQALTIQDFFRDVPG